MIHLTTPLESGKIQLSVAGQGRLGRAAAFPRRHCGIVICPDQSVAVQGLLFLELTHAAPDGDMDLARQVIDRVEELIRSRLASH